MLQSLEVRDIIHVRDRNGVNAVATVSDVVDSASGLYRCSVRLGGKTFPNQLVLYDATSIPPWNWLR